MTIRDSKSAVTSGREASGTETVSGGPTWRDLLLQGGRVTKYKGISCGTAPHSTAGTSVGLSVAAAAVLSLGGMFVSSTAALAGACGPGPNVVCSGPAAPGADTTQTITSPNGDLTITTAPGFGLDVTAGYGVTIDAAGTGNLKFTDENNSSIRADGRALDINAGGLTGAVEVKSTGELVGDGNYGLYLFAGTGVTSSTFDLNRVESANYRGMWVENAGGALSIKSSGAIIGGSNSGVFDGLAVSNYAGATGGIDIDVNDVSGSASGIVVDDAGAGLISIKATGTVTGKASDGIRVDAGSDSTGLRINANNIVAGDDGINTLHSGSGTIDITVHDSIVSGDDAIELYLDTGDVGQVNVNVNNAKGADFGIYIVNHSDAVDPNDPNAVNNDLNITTTGKIEAGSGWGIWAQTDAGVLSNITVKSTSIVDSASGQAIFNDYGDSHVIIENAREIVDDPDTPAVERASVNGVVTLGWGADQLDLHGGFSGITELNGGAGDTDRDVLNLFNANSTYNANKINGWDVFNIKNSYLTLDGPLGNLNVGTAGVAGTGIFLTDGSTLDSRQPGLNIFGNLTLDAGTTFLSDRNDDAGNPGRGDTYITGFLTNGGRVSIADGAADDDVAVRGLYTGSNGTVILDAVLGDDTSATDTMTFSGGTAGHTNVIVNNVGGAGARTVEGIRIIDVSGASDGTFALIGDYEIAGQRAVIGGAYGYTLWKNGVNTPADGDWYLRSQLIPVDPTDPTDPSGSLYQPGAPAFEAYPQILLSLNGLPTLQQRVGNRLWSGNGAGVVSEGADAIDEQAPVGASPVIEGNGIWGRIEGGYANIDPNVSTTGSEYDFNTQKFQAGLDIPVLENGSGALVGGVTAHYGHASADISSVFGDGSISTDGYGVGATLTWYGNNGFYLDGQGQVSWYDSDLESDTLGELASGNNGSGYALSLETGKRIELNDLTLTPQAQLVYSSVDFDSFTQKVDGRDVADVSMREGDSLRGRLGVALDREASWQADNGLLSRSHVYSIANLHYEFLDGAAVDVSDAELANRADRLWGGIGLGGSYNWNDDKYSLHGEGSVNTSLENFADSYDVKGTAGLRVSW